ncbi:MAG: DUF2461 domain-containing protein [Duncaniella sp.]|nr:DUF2461 domain-containing protein [Duncaniella sp.]
MKEILDFIKDLGQNNNREWFNEHKERYLEIKKQVEILTDRLLEEVMKFDPSASNLTAQDCLYRIYRDTRFSADKTPFKDHIGIYICPPFGKRGPNRAGYYLHLQPENCLVAGGVWCPEAPSLRRIRTDIYENVEEYLDIINAPEFRKFYPTVGEDLLKTAPKGFPKDWEHVELLRPKNFVVETPLTDKEICGRQMLRMVVERMKVLKPFNDFLNYAITPPED